MRTFLPLIFMAFFMIVFSESLLAQGFLNKLSKKVQNKVEQKVEKKVDDKVDEEVDKSLDRVFEGEEEEVSSGSNDIDKQNERLQKLMNGMGMSGEPVPISDDYAFDSSLQMHIESYKKNGDKDSEGEFITYVDTDGKNFAYEFIGGDMKQKGHGMFIMDLENKAMIILSEESGERNGIVYGVDVTSFNDVDFDNETFDDIEKNDVKNIATSPYVEKTGRSKTIAGYRCDEYLYDNPEEETKASFWISKNVNIITRDFLNTMLKSATYSQGMPWGCIMESESQNTRTGERSVMRVTDINTNANKQFSMSGYNITNLGSMKMPAAIEEEE